MKMKKKKQKTNCVPAYKPTTSFKRKLSEFVLLAAQQTIPYSRTTVLQSENGIYEEEPCLLQQLHQSATFTSALNTHCVGGESSVYLNSLQRPKRVWVRLTSATLRDTF